MNPGQKRKLQKIDAQYAKWKSQHGKFSRLTELCGIIREDLKCSESGCEMWKVAFKMMEKSGGFEYAAFEQIMALSGSSCNWTGRSLLMEWEKKSQPNFRFLV